MANIPTSGTQDPSAANGRGSYLSDQTFNDLGGAVSDLFSAEGDQYKIEGLELEEQNYEAASKFALQNEQYTKTSTAIKQQQADRNLYMSLGRTQAAVGGAGLANSGSSLDILRESAQQGATARAVVGQQGLITEAGYAEQAQAYQNMAEAAQVAIQGEQTSEVGSYVGAALKGAAALASL